MSTQSESPSTTETPRRGVPRAVWVAAGLVVLVLVGLLVWRLTRDETPPYRDPAASGVLTLCDTEGQQVTSGSITDKPLAPIVLGTTGLDSRVPAQAGAVATLYGFQPRVGVEAAEFSGAPIGGPVAFRDHDRPATRVVKEGYSLANFTEIYPADDDGYVQLRLLIGAEGVGVRSDSYDTADLRIDGDQWHLVRGGHASCKDAAARLTDG